MLSRIKYRHAVMAVALLAAAAPGLAGEITGNGKSIDIHARSECAFSGRNDTPEGDPMDPGGVAQSYGYFGGYWDLWDADEADPHAPGFPPIPGYSCNPNRGADLHE